MSAGSSPQHTTNKNHQLEVQLGGTVTLQCPQGSLGCWSHLDPVNSRLRGLGAGLSTPTGVFSLKDIVYQDAGTYKCVGQSIANKKKLEVLHTMSLNVKGIMSCLLVENIIITYYYWHLFFSQEPRQCPFEIIHRWHIPAHRCTYLLSSVPIRQRSQHVGCTVIVFIRRAINTASMFWPTE